MPNGDRPPLDEWLSLFRAVIAKEGTTTGAGAATGDSIIDSGLIGAGANSFKSMLMVLYPGQPNNVDSMDITAFNNVTGEVTLAKAYKDVAAAIPAGVPYKIVTFRFVPAEVAALQADVGDASTSTLGSLYGILGNPEAALGDSMAHVPKYTGNIFYVDGVNGDDANSGQEPDIAKKTIGAAVTAASAGDRIIVKAAAYNEAIDLNKNGLELVCEQGAILSNTTPGTVLIVSADYCRVVGPILSQGGQTGLQVTGNFNTIKDALAIACSVGFDLGGAENHTDNCRSIQHTTTGFDITGSYGIHRRLVAAGAAAVRGIYLSANTADRNHFHDCHTLGNTTAGWEVVAGADNNLFSKCSTAVDDGARVDNGTNNTWDNFSEGSQIVAGQSRDQDLKDIDDNVSQFKAATLVEVPFYNTTQTVKNSSITLFALDATGATIKDIIVEFYLASDAAATFTPAVYRTRPGDLVTFTEEVVPTPAAIVNPAAAKKYRYEIGDLAQGLQLEFRLAQDNNGNANNDVDATLTCLMEV